MEDSTQVWTQLGPFFQNQGTFFNFQKGQGKLPPPSPSCASVIYNNNNNNNNNNNFIYSRIKNLFK